MSNFQCPKPAQPASTSLSLREQLQRARAATTGMPKPGSCSAEVNIGLFFDGTNNNKKRDQEEVPDPNGRSHSNIVVLYDAFADRRERHYPIYMPGVGTRFPEIGEIAESSEGKALGKGGDSRIYWAMMQVMNAIHRGACNDAPLMQEDEMKRLISGASFLAGGSLACHSLARRRGVFHGLGQRLQTSLKNARPRICQAKLSVFGFSRGAAEARAFCNWLLELCEPGTTVFYGTPLRFLFVGLFDTVASAGLANSAPVPNDGGFMGWADGTMELPGVIEKCVHYTAAHEIRKSFPLSTARKSACTVEEFIYPGTHSDVGGGYAPGEQGKGKTRADLLSQVPLVHMYQTALAAGVPLMGVKELISNNRRDTVSDLQISPDLITRFNEYRQTGPGGGEIRQAMREHLRWYWRWRLAAGERFMSLSSFQAASAQDKEDLGASEKDFRRDLAQAARDEAAIAERKRNPVGAALGDMGRGSSMGYPAAANMPHLSEAEKIVLAEKRARASVPQRVSEFFDHHVHDSHASFYLAGPASAYEKKRLIEDVLRREKAGQSLNGFERRVAALQRTRPGTLPTITDADYADLLERETAMAKITVRMMTATRRESEGHVRERVIFDRS
jgi:uncharacterized protein (DUF2235 family)